MLHHQKCNAYLLILLLISGQFKTVLTVPQLLIAAAPHIISFLYFVSSIGISNYMSSDNKILDNLEDILERLRSISIWSTTESAYIMQTISQGITADLKLFHNLENLKNSMELINIQYENFKKYSRNQEKYLESEIVQWAHETMSTNVNSLHEVSERIKNHYKKDLKDLANAYKVNFTISILKTNLLKKFDFRSLIVELNNQFNF